MIVPFLLAMVSVLVSWILLGGILVGLGLAVARVLRGPGGRAGDAAEAGDAVFVGFWLGYGLVVAFLQIWNYAWPVSGIALAIVAVVGGTGLVTHRRIVGVLTRAAWRERRGVVVATLVAGAWLANLALGPADAHDSGLYHFGVIRWANEYAVVPGLANLSYALALNNSSLLFDAVLNTGPWSGRVEHVANGLLLFALAVRVIVSAARLRRDPTRPRASDVFGVVLAVPLVMLMFSREMASPTTDLPPAALGWVMGWLALVVLERPDAGPREQGERVAGLGVLGAVSVCLKLSAVVFAPLLAVMVGVLWLARDRPPPAAWRRAVASSLVAAVVLLGPWLGRHALMSGYLLHPSTAIRLPVPWRAPQTQVDHLAAAIRDHSRGRLPMWIHDRLQGTPLAWYAPLLETPFDDYLEIEGWEWLRPWFFSLPASSAIEVVLPVLLAIAAWLLVLVRAGRGRPPGPAPRFVALSFALPVASGVGFWFLVSPEPRYVYGVMWTAAAVSVAAAFVSGPARSSRRVTGLLTLVLALALPAVGYRAAVLSVHDRENPWRRIPLRGPGVDRGFHPLPVALDFSVHENRWGVRFFVPQGDGRCWRGPLPCAGTWPPLDPDLRLREPGDPGRGFVIDREPAATP